MRAAAEYLGVSESRVFAVVTFYRTLSQKKKAERSYVSVWVLHAISADQLLFFMNWKKLGIKSGGVTEDGEYTLETVNCVGACALAPVVTSGDITFGRMEPPKLQNFWQGGFCMRFETLSDFKNYKNHISQEQKMGKRSGYAEVPDVWQTAACPSRKSLPKHWSKKRLLMTALLSGTASKSLYNTKIKIRNS